MRALIQRVSQASVMIGGKEYSVIGKGLLILLGIEASDTHEDITYLCSKIVAMRIFNDPDGKMNLDLRQVDGALMVVSQFTLHASTKKGNRPSFIKAARPELAEELYNAFVSAVGQAAEKPCATGIFGADMQVHLVNDGPVTIMMDSKNRE